MALEDRLHASLQRYMAAPEWARAVLGRAYRAVPERVRFGGRYPEFAAEARASIIGVDWARIEARIEATLGALARTPAHVADAPWLLDRRRPPLSRLRALPLVSKSDLKAAPEAYLNLDFDRSDHLETFTGGSTAQPMRFQLQRHVTRPKESAYIREVERSLLRMDRGEWTLSLRGRSVATAVRRQGAMWMVEPIKRHLIFSSDHLEPRYMPSYMEALARQRPRWIHAFPSALYPLARWLDAHPCPSFSRGVRGILLTSESVYDFQSALFRKVFPNATVLEHYGHSERVLMAVQSSDSTGYRFLPLYGLPELVDAEGRPIDRPGVLGEIVGTAFDNHVMPFVRYRTGDMGTWLEPPQFAGQARFVMQRIEGRRQEFVVCADRRLVSITTLGAAHFGELSVAHAIQFEQRTAGRLVLKLVSARPLGLAERDRVARAVRDKTQGGCLVDVVQVDALPRTVGGKHRMLIQHLDLGGYLGASLAPEAGEGRARCVGAGVDA